MSYTLEAAATATGLNQTIILRAINDGTITATKSESDDWLIEAAELQRLHASVAGDVGDDAAPSAQPEVDALGHEIEALLRQAGLRLRQQFDELHRRDADGAEGESLAFVPGEQR